MAQPRNRQRVSTHPPTGRPEPAAAALAEPAARYQCLVEQCPDALLVACDDILVYSNAAGVRLLGVAQRDDLVGKSLWDFVHADSRAQLAHHLRQLRANGKAAPYLPCTFLRLDAHACDAEVAGAAVLYDGQPAIQIVVRDITVRTQAENKRQATYQLQEHIADTLPDLVYLYDLTEQQLVYVNRRLMTLLGHPPENYIGQVGPLFAELVHPEDRPELAARVTQFATATDQTVLKTAFRLRHANGEWRAFQSREHIAQRTEDGAPKHILGAAQDITARKRLDDQLRSGTLDERQLGARLRDLRLRLGLTQAAFGSRFGGYRQRQIYSYETGETDLPLKLLLEIHAMGYPLEAVLGTNTTTLTEQTVHYFSTSYRARLVMRRLIATVSQLLDRDQQTVDQVLEGLGIPCKEPTTEQRHLFEQLADLDKLVE